MLKAEEQIELVVLKRHGESIRALSLRRAGRAIRFGAICGAARGPTRNLNSTLRLLFWNKVVLETFLNSMRRIR